MAFYEMCIRDRVKGFQRLVFLAFFYQLGSQLYKHTAVGLAHTHHSLVDIDTVSYTHLDVYKRQLLQLISY